MQMFKEFSDIRTPDMLNLPVPELEGGKPQTIVARPNDEQKAYMQRISPLLFTVYSAAAFLALLCFSGLFAFTQFFFQT